MPRERLVEAMRGGTWNPVTDGRSLPRHPFQPDASPLSRDIPMVMGNTLHETRNLVGGGDPSLFVLDWERLPDRLERSVGQFIEGLRPADVVSAYRSWYPGYDASDVFFAATTAARSWKSMVVQLDVRAAHSDAPTWVYHLHWPSPVDGGKWGAPHGLDIPLVFDNPEHDRLTRDAGAPAREIARLMSDSLLAFARHGDPNAPGIPRWPAHTLEQRPVMIFDLPPRVEADPRGRERLLFAPAPYVQPGT
jgi:para-nitrobenzyl esterase